MVRTHAAAFAQEFVRRQRWGWLALGVYFLALLIVRSVELATGTFLRSEWGVGYAFAIAVPATLCFYWWVVLFSFGQSANFAARQSILPRRLFTLPLTNAALAAWPMVFGGGAIALLWIMLRLLAPWPTDLPVAMPYVWPGVLAIVMLLWTLSITWMSYPLPGIRPVVAVLWIGVVEVAAIIAIERGASEPFMLAILLPQLPLAFLMARYAVARARRGDVADWSRPFERLRALAGNAATKPPFASAESAQLWLEWKRFGRSLPAMVAFTVPAMLFILLAARNAPALVGEILVMVALTPPFLASFTAVTVRKSGDGDDHGVSPFTATRPLSSAALVGARLRMAVLSTMAAWAIVIVAVPVALVLSGTWSIVVDWAWELAEGLGASRAIVLHVLVLGTLALTTWRQMVQSLYIGLSGRTGLIRGTAMAALVVIIALAVLMDWAWDVWLQAWFWVVLYSALGFIVATRMVVGSWIAIRLQRERQLSDRALVTGAVSWLAAVLAIYAVLLWLFDTHYMPRFLLLLIATVSVPLVRLSAAPLALAWNRHR